MSTVAVDAAKHGACLWCSDDRVVVWHDGSCPEEAAMRPNPVPCRNLECRRPTFRDAFCCQACEDRYEARMAARLTERV